MGCCGDVCVSYDMQPGLLCRCYGVSLVGVSTVFVVFREKSTLGFCSIGYWRGGVCHANLLHAFTKGVYDSWNVLWASSHCVGVRCLFYNVFVRFVVARFCFSINVV